MFRKKHCKPLVSVIMATYNTSENFLRESINSIVNQSYRNLEFIIVDDCSSSNSLTKIVNELHDKRVIILRNEVNKGAAYSRNVAIAHARGKYIAVLDADDVAFRTRIEKQVKYMEKHSEVCVLCSRAKIFGDRKGIRLMIPNTSNYIRAGFIFNFELTHPSTMFRKKFLDKNKLLYDENYFQAQDYELFTRISNLGNVFYELPKCLIGYRASSDQMSAPANNNVQKENAKVIRLRELKKLDIIPSRKEAELHKVLCENCTDGKSIALKDILIWCKRIIAANYDICVFDSRALKRIIANYLIVVLKNKDVKLKRCKEIIYMFKLLDFQLLLAFKDKIYKNIVRLLRICSPDGILL